MDGNNILIKFFSSLANVVRIKHNNDSIYKPTELSEAIEQIDSTISGSIYPDLTCYIPGGITEIETVIIGENATKISNNAYRSCIGLKEVIILGNITSIGVFSFDSCTALEKINLPDSITQISDYAFRSCSKLEDIRIPASIQQVGLTALSGTAWYSKQANNSLVYFGPVLYKLKGNAPDENIIIKQEITQVADYCFENSNIVSFEGSVSNMISSYAFSGCSELIEARFLKSKGSGVALDGYVFSNCVKLNTLYFNNLRSVHSAAFYKCNALTDLYIMNENSIPTGISTSISAYKNQIKLHVHPNLLERWRSVLNGYNIEAYEENE